MPPQKPDGKAIRQRFAGAAPTLWDELSRLAEGWTAPLRARLAEDHDRPHTPKTFNDPIWGTIELFPWEVMLLDSPLLQRLRGVRQLGMVHQVYPSAGHDRLEHTRGVVEAAERIIQALERNAARRRDYGTPEDRALPPPEPSPFDRVGIRLAALLHDIGHGPFSHATEPLIGARMHGDFEACRRVVRDLFPDVTRIAPGELLAALLVLTEPMRAVFEHPGFRATDDPARLAPAIVARILGSRQWLDAGYLSGVISGPLDADKLDYMARDSYHAGLPVALDTNRLINKLEVVAVTPESVSIPSLRERAEQAAGRRYYDVGISLAGLGAYEQMIVGRVILYDRLYYHHKVRAAEAMVRKLIEVAEAERGRPFSLTELFFGLPDDGMVELVSGRLRADGFTGGGGRAQALGRWVRDRELYHRAFAVAQRFIGGLEGLPDREQADVRIYRWGRLLGVTRQQFRRALAHGLGEPLEEGFAIGRVDEQQSLGLVVVEDVEVPGAFAQRLRVAPGHPGLRAGDEEQDSFGLVEPRGLELSGPGPVEPVLEQLRPEGAAAVGDRTELREQALRRDERQRVPVPEFVQALGVLEELHEGEVLLHGLAAEFGEQVVPVRVLAVEPLQGRRNVGVGQVGDDGGSADVRSRRPGEPPDELQCDGEALVAVVERRDLQLREVEPFAQHVDADDDPAPAEADEFERAACVGGSRMDEDGMVRRADGLVHLEHLFRPSDRRAACHEDVIQAPRAVLVEAGDGLSGDRPVAGFGVDLEDRDEGDRLEVPIRLRLLEGVGEDHLPVDGPAVAAERRGGELHHRLAVERLPQPIPGIGRSVVGLVEEEVGAAGGNRRQ